MSHSVTRRTVLAAGAASTGLLFGASCGTVPPAQAEPAPLSNVWGEEFLMQWSEPEGVTKNLTPGTSPIRLSCERFNLRPPNTRYTVSWGDQIRAVREAGYTAVESSGNNWNYAIGDSEVREIQDACRQHDVEFYTLHVWANIIHPDPDQHARIHTTHKNAIEMAERLGMRFILTHTGGRDPQNKDTPHPLNWTRETWDMSVAAVKEILADTAGSPVNLAFEAVNSCNQNTPQSHVHLKQDVGDDRVKVTLDPANMLHPGTYYRTTELLQTCFNLLGEDIMYAHAKDNAWREMLPHIEPVTLGEGSMDFESYLAALSRLSTPRFLLIEHLSAEQYEPSRQYLLDTAERIGVTIYS